MIWSGDKYKIWGDGVIHELPTKLLTTEHLPQLLAIHFGIQYGSIKK